MTKFFGVLIRKERLKQNFSQEGLCKGIRTVSYLSKIEQGKAEAADDILLSLLRRLGIEYETDPAFLQQAEARIEKLYEKRKESKEKLFAAKLCFAFCRVYLRSRG